jgi:uncharacterized membrane protein YfcA
LQTGHDHGYCFSCDRIAATSPKIGEERGGPVEQDTGTIVMLVLALLGAGAFAGVLAGLLGVGGGIVIVPVLFHMFEFLDVDLSVAMHVAVGTSLSTIIATSISSLRAHNRRGAVDWGLLKSWGPAVAIGVIAGTVIAALVSGATLTAIFAVLALVIAAHLAFSPEHLRLADQLPGGPIRFGIGNVIGGLSAMMGIGGGTFTVPTLVMCNYPVHKAVGTASAVGLIIAVPGALGFVVSGLGADGLPPFSLGFVNLLGFILLVPMTVLTAPVGARLAHGMNQRWLRRAFALFLAITSARMFFELS